MFSTGGRGGSTVPNLLYVPCYRGNKECRVLMQKFGVVQAPRTSSNLLEPQQHRVSKVWRGLSQAFGVGRLYRTFSIYSVTGETRSAGCVVQALRTSANLHEPQHHRENKVWRGLSPAFGVVRLYRTFSFYSIAGETRCAGKHVHNVLVKHDEVVIQVKNLSTLC